MDKETLINHIRDLNSDAAEILGTATRGSSPWDNEYLRGQVELATFLLLKDNPYADPAVLKEDLMNDVLAHAPMTADEFFERIKADVRNEADFTEQAHRDGGNDGTYRDYLADLHRRLGTMLGDE